MRRATASRMVGVARSIACRWAARVRPKLADAVVSKRAIWWPGGAIVCRAWWRKEREGGYLQRGLAWRGGLGL
jgi:hypothetical protein